MANNSKASNKKKCKKPTQKHCDCNNALPSEFYQIERTITDINNHPPTPGTNGDKIRMPYVFGPAVVDGDPVTTAYNLQDPTGSMPTWDNGYVMYQGDSGDACGCFNVIPAYGVTSQFFLGLFNTLGGMVAKSDSAQTLQSAFLQQLNPTWAYGNLNLPAGWSVVQIVEDTAEVTALPIAQIQAIL